MASKAGPRSPSSDLESGTTPRLQEQRQQQSSPTQQQPSPTQQRQQQPSVPQQRAPPAHEEQQLPLATASQQVPKKEEVLGEWLFENGLEGKVAQTLRAKSDVVKNLKALLADHEASRNNQEPWIKSQQADVVFGCIIMAYAVLAGIDVEITVRPIKVPPAVDTILFILQILFMITFITELVLRIRSDGWRFCSPFHQPAGFFDTVIIFLGSLELLLQLVLPGSDILPSFALMRVFRLLRCVRIVRVLLVRKELKLLFVGMFSSLSAVFWSFLLLMVLMYLGTLVCVILLGEQEELADYFGSVPMGMFTHFMIVTLEAWPDISDAVMAVDGSIWAVYFMIFICVTSLALMNLVTGVVCDKLMGASTSSEEVGSEGNQVEAYLAEVDKFHEELRVVVKECDWDGSTAIDAREFQDMIERSDMKELCERMEITTDLDGEQMFEILDVSSKGELSFEELAASLMRLRGSRKRLHSVLLQKDLVRGARIERERIENLANAIQVSTRRELELTGDTLIKQLEEIEQQLPALVSSMPSASGIKPRSEASSSALASPEGAAPMAADKVVMLDFDQTTSIVHVFHLLGDPGNEKLQELFRARLRDHTTSLNAKISIILEDLAEGGPAKTEKGQVYKLVHTIHKRNNTDVVHALFGGSQRVQQLADMCRRARASGATLYILTRGYAGVARVMMHAVGLLDYFREIYGLTGSHYARGAPTPLDNDVEHQSLGPEYESLLADPYGGELSWPDLFNTNSKAEVCQKVARYHATGDLNMVDDPTAKAVEVLLVDDDIETEIKSAVEARNPKVHAVPVTKMAGIGIAEMGLISDFVSGKCVELNKDSTYAAEAVAAISPNVTTSTALNNEQEVTMGREFSFARPIQQEVTVRRELDELQAKELVTSTLKATTANPSALAIDTGTSPREQVQHQENELTASRVVQRLERLLEELDGLHGTARNYLAPAASSSSPGSKGFPSIVVARTGASQEEVLPLREERGSQTIGPWPPEESSQISAVKVPQAGQVLRAQVGEAIRL